MDLRGPVLSYNVKREEERLGGPKSDPRQRAAHKDRVRIRALDSDVGVVASEILSRRAGLADCFGQALELVLGQNRAPISHEFIAAGNDKGVAHDLLTCLGSFVSRRSSPCAVASLL